MKSLKYRTEIDGLRALAVLSVVFFHAGINNFSGGFVGVDVFFVISGYLISSLIIAEIRLKKFSILTFYERRARRLLPALFLIMFISLPFAWILMTPQLLKDFGQSLVATNLFLSNFLFWIEKDYFETAAEMKPLLHAWSLSVEEQFYLLFPIFLILFWRFGTVILTALILIIIFLSFSVTLFGYQIYCCSPFFFNTIDSFYLPFGRIWELMAGVLCSIYLLDRNQPKKYSNIFSLIGFSLIVYSIFNFDHETKFPSHLTAIPIIGTVLMIIFCNPKNLLGRFFSTKPLVFVGLISYSLYLWHFIIFVFARFIFINPPNYFFYYLIIFSIGISYLSWKFVERPFRDRSRFNSNQIFLFSIIGIFAFISIGTVISMNNGFKNRYSISNELIDTIERSRKDQECFEADFLHLEETHKWGCKLGEADNEIDYLITGDSHAYSLLDMIESALINSNKTGFFTGTASCPPLIGIHNDAPDTEIHNCFLLNEKIYKYVKQQKIKDIFFIARWSIYTIGDHNRKGMFHIGLQPRFKKTAENSFTSFSISFKKTIEMYDDIGVNVHIISEAPLQYFDSKYIYYRSNEEDNDSFRNNLEAYSVLYADHLSHQHQVQSIFDGYKNFKNLYLWNYDKIFCKDLCMVGTTKESFYYDDDHLSISGAMLLEKEFIEKFRKLSE